MVLRWTQPEMLHRQTLRTTASVRSIQAVLFLRLPATGGLKFSGGDNGPATTSASLATPVAVAVDAAGNIYIADRDNQRIRKVDSRVGSSPLSQGTGVWDSAATAGEAAGAALAVPYGVTAVDSAGKYLYRRITTTNVSARLMHQRNYLTVAGNGSSGFIGDGGQSNKHSNQWPQWSWEWTLPETSISPTPIINASERSTQAASSPR